MSRLQPCGFWSNTKQDEGDAARCHTCGHINTCNMCVWFMKTQWLFLKRENYIQSGAQGVGWPLSLIYTHTSGSDWLKACPCRPLDNSGEFGWLCLCLLANLTVDYRHHVIAEVRSHSKVRFPLPDLLFFLSECLQMGDKFRKVQESKALRKKQEGYFRSSEPVDLMFSWSCSGLLDLQILLDDKVGDAIWPTKDWGLCWWISQ